MSRGGAKPGERRGGRQKGTPNRLTTKTKALLQSSGLLPLEYMLRVMRDKGASADRRDAMARAAAPYVHSQRKAIEHTGEGGGPIKSRVIISLD